MAKFSTGYTFGFAAAICVVCSVSVAGVSMALGERQALNRERDLHKNILLALGLPESGPPPSGEVIDRLWDERVEQRFLTGDGAPAGPELDQDGDGDLDTDDVNASMERAGEQDGKPQLLGVYVRKDDGKDGAIALPMVGNGLWGPIAGYLAVDPSGRKVTGATFFAPKETPGLGAEIQETPFEAQWVGKELADNNAPAPISVVKGDPGTLCAGRTEHCVQGVSGATITSRGVDAMVARAVRWYDPFLAKLQGSRP